MWSLRVIDMWGKEYNLDQSNFKDKTSNYIHFIDKTSGITGEYHEVYVCQEKVYYLVYWTPCQEDFRIVNQNLCFFQFEGQTECNTLDFSVTPQAKLISEYQDKSHNSYPRADLDDMKSALVSAGLFKDTDEEIKEPHKSYLKRLYGKSSLSNRVVNQAFESLGLADFPNRYKDQIRFFSPPPRK